MWSFLRRSPRPAAAPFRARLTLESLDQRLAPSDLPPVPGDPPENETYFPAPPTNAPPQIINFSAAHIVGGAWRFTGDVIDEFPSGLTITLGGAPDSLQGVTTTTNASGHFEIVVFLNTDGTDSGTATAQTVDNIGQQSNLAMYIVHP